MPVVFNACMILTSQQTLKLVKLPCGVEAVQDRLSIAAASGMEVAMDVEEYMRFEREMPTENIID